MGAVPILSLLIETWPARISAFSRERDSSLTCAASTRWRRGEPSLPSTLTSSLSAPIDESSMSETEYPEPTAEQAALFARVRRMMLIASVTTAVAIAAVLVAVGYRLFKSEGSAEAALRDVTEMLPKGARIASTAIAGDKLVLILDIAGTTEIRTFDAQTLKPAGR